MPPTVTAGWKEYADFPEWGLRRVKVKLDTGAKSACIGVVRCELIAAAGGGHVAELHIAPDRLRPDRVTVVRAPVVRFVRVRNTGGEEHVRPVVELELRLGPVRKRVRATVSDRSKMLVKVLLGRTALAPEVAVDPGRKYLLSGRARGA